MTTVIHNIIYRAAKALLAAIFALTAAAACCSCSDQNIPPELIPGGDSASTRGTIGLYLSLGDDIDMPLPSRSTPDDGPFDPGSGYENYIHLDGDDAPDIRVLIYDKEGLFFSIIENPKLVRLQGPYPSSKKYELYFDIDQEFYNKFGETDDGIKHDLKIVILANWKSYPEAAQLQGSNLKDLYALSAAPWNPIAAIDGPDKRIPLAAVKHINEIDILPSGNTSWCGNFNLIRAVAKIDLTDAIQSDTAMVKVELQRFSRKLFKYPAGMDHQDKYVTGSWSTDYLSNVTVDPDDPDFISNETVEFEKVGEATWRIYCAEFDNLSARSDDELSRIVVTYADNTSYYIDFKNYSGPEKDKRFNVCRNNWYKFEVKRGYSKLECTVDVLPFGVVTLDPVFGVTPGFLRESLSLQKNPRNMKKQIQLIGMYDEIDGVRGVLRLPTSYAFINEDNDEIDKTVKKGKEENPYFVDEVHGVVEVGANVWIRGWIVGSSASDDDPSGFTTSLADASNTNLFIATTPDETDYRNCVMVHLPPGYMPLLPIYDPETGLMDCWLNTNVYPPEYLSIDQNIQVPSPYLDRDPDTGYTIMTDDEGRIQYYYDRIGAFYYLPGNLTFKVPSPYLPVVTIYVSDPDDPDNPDNDIQVDCLVMIDEEGQILWFYDPVTKTYYNPDHTPSNMDPLNAWVP